MLEDLKNLIDGAQGHAIDVAHPSTIRNTQVTPITKWYKSELPNDFERNVLGGIKTIDDPEHPDFGKPVCKVSAQIVKSVNLDEYDEPIGAAEYVVQVKLAGQKDIASDRIGTYTSRNLRRRFPKAFNEFEAKLKASGEDLPIDLLDGVPPAVIHILAAKGTKTVKQFANYNAKQLNELKKALENIQLFERAKNVEKYRDQASEKAGLSASQEVAA